jgi:hypothetical protein
MFAPAAKFRGLVGLMAIVTSSGSILLEWLTMMLGYWPKRYALSRNIEKKIAVKRLRITSPFEYDFPKVVQ